MFRACSTPMASRSFAANTASGRSPAGRSRIASPAARPSSTVSDSVVDRPRGSRRARRRRPVGRPRADRRPGGCSRAADERDPPTPGLEEVRAPRAPRPRRRRPTPTRGCGPPDTRSTSTTGVLPPAQALQPRLVFAERRDEHAVHPLLLEEVEVRALAIGVLVAVAEQDGHAVLGGAILGSARDLGEERVPHVEHDEPDAAAPPGAQLPRRVVAHEPELVDRGHHARHRVRRDLLGPVEHVRDRAHRHGCRGRDVADTHCHLLPPLAAPHRTRSPPQSMIPARADRCRDIRMNRFESCPGCREARRSLADHRRSAVAPIRRSAGPGTAWPSRTSTAPDGTCTVTDDDVGDHDDVAARAPAPRPRPTRGRRARAAPRTATSRRRAAAGRAPPRGGSRPGPRPTRGRGCGRTARPYIARGRRRSTPPPRTCRGRGRASRPRCDRTSSSTAGASPAARRARSRKAVMKGVPRRADAHRPRRHAGAGSRIVRRACRRAPRGSSRTWPADWDSRASR